MFQTVKQSYQTLRGIIQNVFLVQIVKQQDPDAVIFSYTKLIAVDYYSHHNECG